MKIDRKTAIKILILTVGIVLAIPVIYNIIIHEYYKEENLASFWAMILGYIIAMSLLVVAFLPYLQHSKALSEGQKSWLENPIVYSTRSYFDDLSDFPFCPSLTAHL